HVWYWGGGLNLMFWRRIPDGRLVAVEVDRVQLLADVVARLPDTGSEGGEETTALIDSAGEVIYQWGAWTPAPSQAPRILHALPAPLAAWRLAWTGTVPVPAGMAPGLLIGLVAIGLALAGLAVWFYRESTRALREAARRVTFVNQVSHELKTPLTNIRMYAELLADELDDEDDRAARHVAIIEGESQRLSRLIGNILTFARQSRDALQLRPTEAVIDDVIRDAIEGFAPSLERCGVAVAFEPGAPATVRVDADALGQILGNLLSNVEKYAHGGPVRITAVQTPTDTTITVHDSGPGIPRGDRQRVFEPFERLSDALEEGVSGTGIGLGIARDLARLHGGDLTLLPTERGAAFELRLRHA
ncbi:MAG: HAMP domain-containing histidine kinase, partial [Acidobacteria bacterium]|nr:HAMP domain-containing histidine kinase [Acidobacteriota bacterium]